MQQLFNTTVNSGGFKSFEKADEFFAILSKVSKQITVKTPRHNHKDQVVLLPHATCQGMFGIVGDYRK